MRAIITSDIHLSDRPADAYRFGLFAWLRAKLKRERAEYLFILGDLTQEKDHHSAVLVNRVVDELRRCAEDCRVFILRGNHDGVDPAHPFFGFVDDGNSRLRFISQPILTRSATPPPETILLLPHSREPATEWAEFELTADYIFMHQTFKGAIAESGVELPGMSTRDIKPRLLAVSGDIHVPQTIGPVVYCGAPYHVRFGDDFIPRVLMIEGGKTRDLHFPAPRKLVIEAATIADLEKQAANFCEGDQARLTLALKKRDFDEWSATRQKAIEVCAKAGISLHGVEIKQLERPAQVSRREDQAARRSPREIMEEFAERRGVAPDVLAAGLKIVES